MSLIILQYLEIFILPYIFIFFFNAFFSSNEFIVQKFYMNILFVLMT